MIKSDICYKYEHPIYDDYYIKNDYHIYKYNKEKGVFRLLKENIRNGYKYITLYKQVDGKLIHTTKTVHRMVAETFIPNPENKPQVNHKDGNKLNNNLYNLYNLEWATASENTQHAYNNGLTHLKTGANSPNAIPIDQYSLDGEFIKTWGGATCVRNELGINKSNIIQCCKKHGKYKSAGGYIWKYHDESVNNNE